MNVAAKHPVHADLPAVLPDPEEGGPEPGRIPHVSIHVFHETDEFGALWRRAERDRRLFSATTSVRQGGFPAAIRRYAGERSPDLIIIETEATEEALEYQVDSLADVCHADTRLIIIGKRNDIQLYRKLLNMGVSSYLVEPVGVGTVLSAIADIYREPGHDKIGRATAVLGAKGGVGSSRVAQSLALELSRRRDSDVLLVDLDLAFGTDGLDLDIEPNHGLVEILRDPERIDAEMLDRILVKRGDNLSLLGATATLEHGCEIDEEAIDRLIGVAQSHVRQIVLDVPHLWATWVERTVIAADEVVVVATPELACLRNAVQMIARVKSLRPNDPPPHFVLNQVGMPRRQEVTAKDIAQILEIQPAVSIPFDAKAFSQATARGKLVAEVTPRRPVVQAHAKLAALIDPEEAPAVRRRRGRWFMGRRRGKQA